MQHFWEGRTIVAMAGISSAPTHNRSGLVRHGLVAWQTVLDENRSHSVVLQRLCSACSFIAAGQQLASSTWNLQGTSLRIPNPTDEPINSRLPAVRRNGDLVRERRSNS